MDYIEKMKDPMLVWQFQYYFGIRRPAENTRVKDLTGSKCNGSSAVTQNGRLTMSGDGMHCNHSISKLSKASNHASKEGYEDCGPPNATNNGHLASIYADAFPNVAIKEKNGFYCVESDGYSKNGAEAADQIFSDDTSCATSDSDSGSVKSGEIMGQKYIITQPIWYYLFCFGSALGDEAFYASFFPFWFWNVDGAVCRRVVMIWVMIMYIGQGLKDVIKWPRPASPPAIRMEEKWALEYGMPSTHAMVGAAVPFSFLFYTMYRYEYPVILGVLLCSVWCCLICGSRLYLGMHTVLDIVAGILLVVLLMIVVIPFIDNVDYLILTGRYSPPVLLVTYICMIIFYPDAGHWTPARGDAVVILGVGAGVSFGSWLNYQWGIISGPPIPPPYTILWPTYEMVGLTLLRTCIGILVVVATRAIFRSITYAVACHLLKLDPRDKANNRKRAVEFSSKFVTYCFIAFNVTYSSPAVFRFLNIERATMFTEV